MTELIKRTCQCCGHTDEDVLHYYQKVGGSDQPIEQTVCEDIDKCLERENERIQELEARIRELEGK